MRRRDKGSILAMLPLIVATLLPGLSQASFDLPAPDHALMLELGVPDLSIGMTGETQGWQARGGLRYRLGSDVLSAQLGGLRRLGQLGPVDFDLGVDAGPLLALRDGPVYGGFASTNAAAGLRLADWTLRAGPRAELAVSFDDAVDLVTRVDLLASCAVGWQARPVAVWLRGEAGYTVGGQGPGALTARFALVLHSDLRTLGLR